MKRIQGIIVFAAILAICATFTGCIVTAFPDPAEEITMKVGETAFFTAVSDSQGFQYFWYVDGARVDQTGAIVQYTATTKGTHTIEVMDNSLDSRTWNITVTE